jgi:hypothetical protein
MPIQELSIVPVMLGLVVIGAVIGGLIGGEVRE